LNNPNPNNVITQKPTAAMEPFDFDSITWKGGDVIERPAIVFEDVEITSASPSRINVMLKLNLRDEPNACAWLKTFDANAKAVAS